MHTHTHTHTCILYAHNVRSQYVLDYRPGDISACVADLGWIAAHSYSLYAPLCIGGTSVLFESIPNYPNPGRRTNPLMDDGLHSTHMLMCSAGALGVLALPPLPPIPCPHSTHPCSLSHPPPVSSPAYPLSPLPPTPWPLSHPPASHPSSHHSPTWHDERVPIPSFFHSKHERIAYHWVHCLQQPSSKIK